MLSVIMLRKKEIDVYKLYIIQSFEKSITPSTIKMMEAKICQNSKNEKSIECFNDASTLRTSFLSDLSFIFTHY